MSAISPEKEKKAEAKAEAEKKAEETKEASPDKKSSSSDELKLKEAMGNLAAGKRNLLINDVSGAVSSFAEACKMMGEIYGETAAECGEAFFYYGKALLEMARMENGVLENGLGGVPDGEDKECSNIEDPEKMTEEEKEDVAEKVGEAIEIGNQKAEEEKAAVDAKKAPEDKPKDAKAAGPEEAPLPERTAVQAEARPRQHFKELLLRSYGNILRAWRQCLDRDGNGTLDFKEFSKACADVGYAGSRRELWNDLDADGSGGVSSKSSTAQLQSCSTTCLHVCGNAMDPGILPGQLL